MYLFTLPLLIYLSQSFHIFLLLNDMQGMMVLESRVPCGKKKQFEYLSANALVVILLGQATRTAGCPPFHIQRSHESGSHGSHDLGSKYSSFRNFVLCEFCLASWRTCHFEIEKVNAFDATSRFQGNDWPTCLLLPRRSEEGIWGI